MFCDRSLVMVSVLIVVGQSVQIGYYLNRVMDNGFLVEEVGEVVVQVVFYVGWLNVFIVVLVVGEVL